MSADPVVYCLETLTDYSQFERLASDLMAGTDYPGIEPLGGSGDGGRDALHIHKDMGVITIFAYSVRSDWASKLRADCKRIAEKCYYLDTIVFVSTQAITTPQKDNMRREIQEHYDWSVEFYDIERIRLLLTGPLTALVGKHPAIFVSPWFERRGGEVVTHEQRDLILIDHIADDHAFASWLFKRLSAAGYSVWCHGLAPLAGENADASVRTLIRQRAARYLPVLSVQSMADPNLRSRMAIAGAVDGCTLPCWLSDLSECNFEWQLAEIVPARFDVSWASGLFALETQVMSAGIGKTLGANAGRRIALAAYSREKLLVAKPERVYSNVFSAKVPEAIVSYELERDDVEIEQTLERRWAHVRRGARVFAFSAAPERSPLDLRSPLYYSWRRYPERFGANSEHLIKMLVKRSLFVACREAGFEWCDDRHTFYLGETKPRRHRYQHVDNVCTRVSFTGERTWGFGELATKYRYQIGPVFRVTFDDEGAVWVMLRLYVRVTDVSGQPLDAKLIPSRRKRVTRSWWNRQWLQRTLGMMQFIAGKGADIKGSISIGSGRETVSVNVSPLSWECPVSIDSEALERVGDFQNELALSREVEDSLPSDLEIESDD